MTSTRSDRLTIALGALLVALGVAETARVVAGEGVGWPLAFWFTSLVGGGVLILVGHLLSRRRRWLSFALVTLGCVAGANATLWTLLIPVAAAAVIALSFASATDDAEQHRHAN
jgi:hypothetical protein